MNNRAFCPEVPNFYMIGLQPHVNYATKIMYAEEISTLYEAQSRKVAELFGSAGTNSLYSKNTIVKATVSLFEATKPSHCQRSQNARYSEYNYFTIIMILVKSIQRVAAAVIPKIIIVPVTYASMSLLYLKAEQLLCNGHMMPPSQRSAFCRKHS